MADWFKNPTFDQAAKMERDHSVLTVSYEMTKKQLSRRSAATLGKIPQRFLQVGFDENNANLPDRVARKRFVDAIAKARGQSVADEIEGFVRTNFKLLRV